MKQGGGQRPGRTPSRPRPRRRWIVGSRAPNDSTTTSTPRPTASLRRAGAYKNPGSHGIVDFGDPVEAAESIQFAEPLLRQVERANRRRRPRQRSKSHTTAHTWGPGRPSCL
ncbi:hypothetical protein B9W64_00085 [Streptomyces sp. CS159]|nr:hypothetical protein B9W64_00085 [Streptomyces sp. CS159]